MQPQQAFQFELMPIGVQERNMLRYASACRFVYNQTLAWQTEHYSKDKTVQFSYVKLANLLPVWKKE